MREDVQARAPELSEEEATSIARVAGGRLDRAERLLDPEAAKRRAELLEVARSVYADPSFDAGRGGRAAAGVGDGPEEPRRRSARTRRSKGSS